MFGTLKLDTMHPCSLKGFETAGGQSLTPERNSLRVTGDNFL